uniref:BACK domain-containing protein n=1 Tax=Electrophorus electricus TaxID=8005 RepID=A0A4W4DQ53_ELEEL
MFYMHTKYDLKHSKYISIFHRTLFASDRSPPETFTYNITGVSPDIMWLLVDYAYIHSVLVNEDNVEELLVAANQFFFLGVVHTCCQFLEAQLDLENNIGFWKLANLYSCWDLRQEAYLFILHCFEEIVCASEEFLELSLTELFEIIEKDNLNVKHDVVFEAILRWVTHAPQERAGHIAILLMALMTADYFMNNIKTNAVLKDSGWRGGSPTNDIEAYDARADGWVIQEEESPQAYHSAAYLNGFVYCVGGFDSIEYYNSVRKFNPVTRTWHQVSNCALLYMLCLWSMSTNQWTMITPMHEQSWDASAKTMHGKVCTNTGTHIHTHIAFSLPHTVQVVDNLMFVVGGLNGFTTTYNMECYDKTTEAWYDAHDKGIFWCALSRCLLPGVPNHLLQDSDSLFMQSRGGRSADEQHQGSSHARSSPVMSGRSVLRAALVCSTPLLLST